MISLNDVLLAMSNIPVDDPIAEIWGRGLQDGDRAIEYTGTLPIAITANGDALLDYRIYGASGGVGVATKSGEPAGYKLPMIVNNGITNIVPPTPAETKTSNGITVTSDGKGTYTISGTATAAVSLSFYFDHSVSCGSKNTIALFNSYAVTDGAFRFVGQEGVFSVGSLNRVLYNISGIAKEDLRGVSFGIPSGATVNGTISPLIFDGVNITPTEFVPYVPPVSYNVPVYIGENQLMEDEYVSYGEQKIYRDVSGTLTPIDPPVPFPKSPTIGGTTIIDYDGTPKPSQMYVKYKGKSDGE